ncbi:MAG: heme biosynthesis protein HemY [Methylococcales bacterium]|nr:heme biosynthesis protein HemY [Methylococcales bacterium]
MKKKAIYFLIILLIIGAAGYFLYTVLSGIDNPGYVLIGFSHWSLESSLITFFICEIVVFALLYFFFRLLGWFRRLPKRFKSTLKEKKEGKSQNALISGLVDSAEGNWEKAEKLLIKHASNSGAPLLHYLTAARAAQSRGALDKRDEYLKKAKEQDGDTDIAVGLTEAELHLSENQFDQALETLTHLESMDSTRASVLKLLHQTYQKMDDWEGVRRLLPSLHKNKVMLEAEVKLLEKETFSRLLKQMAKEADADKIQGLWKEVPKHLQSDQGTLEIYFAAMISAGASAKVEKNLAKALVKNWSPKMLILYGNVESENYPKQLQTAEQGLSLHSGSAILLRVLGKISIKCQQMEKAEQYLTKSLAAEPTVVAYQLLGDVLVAKGEALQASEYYKQGLELAAGELVSLAEGIVG